MSYANDMSRTTNADTELASALQIAAMRLARRLRAERTDSSLTLTQLAALATLQRHGPLSPGELAAHERVQPPSMTRVVAVLERRGLVTRAAHPTDGRQVLLSATAAAHRLLLADRRRREAWLVDRMAALSPAERAVLREAAPLLERLAVS
ncbi:MAG: MarR family transcriptional regulator [Actinomycetia bacterium]|nr:MarR family transcriptional regulator [Actinomycetes bacterium]